MSAGGMAQEQLAYIVDRAPRTIIYNGNDGQQFSAILTAVFTLPSLSFR